MNFGKNVETFIFFSFFLKKNNLSKFISVFVVFLCLALGPLLVREIKVGVHTTTNQGKLKILIDKFHE